ncbi:MAG: hypothetical protein AB1791_19010 [Chloroflexota bacterium]
MKLIPIALIGLAVLFFSGSFGVSKFEERDSFCISCHTAPEVVYYERTHTAAQSGGTATAPDLASFHYAEEPAFNCIDCHRGDQSLGHRAKVLVLAMGDTITFVTGQSDPMLEKANVPSGDPNDGRWHGAKEFSKQVSVLNASCVQCHQETLTTLGLMNHFHHKLPAAVTVFQQTGQLYFLDDWMGGTDGVDALETEETAVTCMDCHRAHVTGDPADTFVNVDEIVLPACVQCHLESGRGPIDLLD